MKKTLLVIIGIIAFVITVIFPPILLLWGLILLIWLGYFFVSGVFYRLVHGKTKMDTYLEEQNAIHGTNFSHKKMCLGNVFSGLMFFDLDNRKILIHTAGVTRVVDYDYIKSWQLNWVEKSKNNYITYSDVHFQFATTDINNPTVRISVPRKNIGEDWNNRLNIIFSE
ncbi:MAG: hypothetical protein KAI85_03470 [Halopseudomonas aestusnigri]|nr:hypothetical protein [Halopseudomonas aestusnigri]